MKKKSLTLALALVILSFALSACGGTEPQDIGSALGDVAGCDSAAGAYGRAHGRAPAQPRARPRPDTQPSAPPDDGGNEGGWQDVNLDDFLYDWLDFSGYPLTPDELIEFFGEPPGQGRRGERTRLLHLRPAGL